MEKHCSAQGIEGISLGCTFLDAKFSIFKYILLGVFYVIVTPIGIGAKPLHTCRCILLRSSFALANCFCGQLCQLRP